ncbi:GDP-mannose dehydrogenase, partial [Geothermobacter hydrogeniphilus]
MITTAQIISRKAKIAVVGLGYVGLPLAAAFGRKVEVIGFDIDARKLEQLRGGFDATGELSSEQLAATAIDYTADPARLKEAQFLIVTVPTPIDGNKK